MGQHNVSWFVIVLVFVLDLIAFGLALGAERRRAKGQVEDDSCVYDSDIATGLGIGAALFLLFSQAFVSAATRCLCCGPALMPGAARVFAIIFCILSWICFTIAELSLIVGSARNAKHYHYRGYFGASGITCSSLRKGTFAAGAFFALFSFISNVFYYICYSTARDGSWRNYKESDTGVGMTGYS